MYPWLMYSHIPNCLNNTTSEHNLAHYWNPMNSKQYLTCIFTSTLSCKWLLNGLQGSQGSATPLSPHPCSHTHFTCLFCCLVTVAVLLKFQGPTRTRLKYYLWFQRPSAVWWKDVGSALWPSEAPIRTHPTPRISHPSSPPSHMCSVQLSPVCERGGGRLVTSEHAGLGKKSGEKEKKK